jgi:DNA-binding MarR family transcriptional regulator
VPRERISTRAKSTGPAGERRRAVSDLRGHVGFWMRFVSNYVLQSFTQKLRKKKVTVAEWVVLRQAYDYESIAPSELAEQIGLTRGAVSRLVDRLAAKKLMTRENGKLDRRYKKVALSAAGRRLVPHLTMLADQNDVEFFDMLSAKEREALMETFKRIVVARGLRHYPTD